MPANLYAQAVPVAAPEVNSLLPASKNAFSHRHFLPGSALIMKQLLVLHLCFSSSIFIVSL